MVLVWFFPSLFVSAVGLKCLVRFKSLFSRDFADSKPGSSLLCCSSQSSPVAPSLHWLGIINPIPALMGSLSSKITVPTLQPVAVLVLVVLSLHLFSCFTLGYSLHDPSLGFIWVKLSSLELHLLRGQVLFYIWVNMEKSASSQAHR